MTQLPRVLLTLVMVVAAVAAGTWVWNYYLYSPWTRDGRVRADVITIAPDVSGWVIQLNVKDNQLVKKGDVLFTVDDTRYKAKIAEDSALVEKAEYTWKLAQHEYERRQRLNDKSAISDEDLDTYRIDTLQNKASYDIAVAQLNTANINLIRTVVTAPEDGTITNLNLRQGNYVNQGVAVLSLVKSGSFYITGYFEETKLSLIKVGQKATVHLMSGGKPLTGKVASIAKGIANSNTSADNQLLPQVQQTFNWVRLAQRIPVDIVLDNIDDETYLSAGMTASVDLRME
ncbi:HlyD family secretion protein [Paraglaciecola sp.]|uniref:HlyD family secretion protein n=1 Tax=Paraglaciecola sp. TaxID=1920173 RepID=UPI0030F4A0D2